MALQAPMQTSSMPPSGETNGEREGKSRGGSHRQRGRHQGSQIPGRGRPQRSGPSHSEQVRGPGSGPMNTSAPPGQTLRSKPPDLGGGSHFSSRPTEGGKGKEGEELAGEGSAVAEEVLDAEVCFICASVVVHHALGPCNHRSCHICALRLRALYKTKACAHCRTEAESVIFTDSATRRFEEFLDGDIKEKDAFGIKYEKKEIYDDTVLLLQYNCPEKDCDIACLSWEDLRGHVQKLHHKVMCKLCTRNKKVFCHEHELFTVPELRRHEKFGDDHPGAADQSGFKGHPECGFCRERFYGDDELYTHCRDKHERCHLCDRRNPGRPEYFRDYPALEKHFSEKHFMCLDKECLEKKFVVFNSEIDLKAHQLEAHPNGLSKDARRDASRVDMTNFDFRTPYQENRPGRGRGRGRNPNAEPLPQSTAQPLRRDELAYQRQMALQSQTVQGAQSATSRTFGGQLSRPERVQEPRPDTVLNGDTLVQRPAVGPSPDLMLTPQEQARRFQHSAVMDRASSLLKHNDVKNAEFRTQVSAYKNSSITSAQLVDAFVLLFEIPALELGKLIKELADIYENESKRSDLLKAWNDWRAIHEDYPSLPGAPSTSASSGSGGRRILKLKSSTAQSSRSAVSKQASWGAVNAAAVISSMPTLASANRAGKGKVGPTPWATASSSKQPPLVAAPVVRGDAFPALPAASKPNTTMVGIHRGAVNWIDNRSAPGANPWGGRPGSAPLSAEASEAEGTGSGEVFAGKKKKQQGKKQTLYKFG